MWTALLVIVLLTVLSVYGAFMGAERAQEYFNRVPLAVYWLFFAGLLVVALAVFPRLIRVPGLLLVHAGCVLILAGGMWGSKLGNDLQKRFVGFDKVRSGRMVIYEGATENKVMPDGARDFKELPFAIGLKDFRIEYYEPAYLEFETAEGQSKKIPAEVGQESDLGGELGKAKIVRKYENFKMSMEDGKRIAFEDPHPGSNPALEVQITAPDGEVTTQYVFSLMPGFGHTQGKLKLTYNRPINRAVRDYVSELEVTVDGKVVAEKDIEVNHPLHFGGYHFYQSSYDDKAGQYTVLSVYSDTGLFVVYAGYWMLCLGVIWHLWLRHALARAKLKSTNRELPIADCRLPISNRKSKIENRK
jgi:hypothetical protein